MNNPHSPRPQVNSPRPQVKSPRVGGSPRPDGVTPLPLALIAPGATNVQALRSDALYQILGIMNSLDTVAEQTTAGLLKACQRIVLLIPRIKTSLAMAPVAASAAAAGPPSTPRAEGSTTTTLKALIGSAAKHITSVLSAGRDALSEVSDADFMTLYTNVCELAWFALRARADLVPGSIVNKGGMLMLEPLTAANMADLGELHIKPDELHMFYGPEVPSSAAQAGRALIDIPLVHCEIGYLVRAMATGDGQLRAVGVAIVQPSHGEVRIALFYIVPEHRLRYAWYAMCSVLDIVDRENYGYPMATLLTAELASQQHVLPLVNRIEPLGKQTRLHFALARRGLITPAMKAHQLVHCINYPRKVVLGIYGDELLLMAQTVLCMTPARLSEIVTGEGAAASFMLCFSRCMYDRIVYIHNNVPRTAAPPLCTSDSEQAAYSLDYVTRKLAEWATAFAEKLTLTNQDVRNTWAWSTALNRRIISQQTNRLCLNMTSADMHISQNGEVSIVQLSDGMREQLAHRPFMKVITDATPKAGSTHELRWFVVYTVRQSAFVPAGIVQLATAAFGCCIEYFQLDECYRGTRVEFSALDCVLEYLSITPLRTSPCVAIVRTDSTANMLMFASRGFTRMSGAMLVRELAATPTAESDTIGPLARPTDPASLICRTCETPLNSQTERLQKCVVRQISTETGSVPALVCERCLNFGV